MKRRGNRKTRQGTVVSDSMDKTVVVAIERLDIHPVYKKVVRRRTKCYAHDERNDAHVGDRVLIVESRPLSRHKRWRVQRVVERAK